MTETATDLAERIAALKRTKTWAWLEDRVRSSPLHSPGGPAEVAAMLSMDPSVQFTAGEVAAWRYFGIDGRTLRARTGDKASIECRHVVSFTNAIGQKD
jgi:hypothetical protein